MKLNNKLIGLILSGSMLLSMAACGSAEKEAEPAVCMSVYDFNTDKELLSVELANPKNVTYRCVYYE